VHENKKLDALETQQNIEISDAAKPSVEEIVDVAAGGGVVVLNGGVRYRL